MEEAQKEVGHIINLAFKVTAKGIERVSHQLGEEAEGFQKKEVNEVLSDKVIPIRDENSTSYVGAIERADEFGKRIYGEAMRRGLGTRP